ncbi:unnamed protein product [Ectocarpus sp. 12 AP-2014]
MAITARNGSLLLAESTNKKTLPAAPILYETSARQRNPPGKVKASTAGGKLKRKEAKTQRFYLSPVRETQAGASRTYVDVPNWDGNKQHTHGGDSSAQTNN